MPAERADARFGAEEFGAIAGVSRETLERLRVFVAMLEDWGARQNLVSRASLADVWRRHVWDSAQLVPLIPEGARSLTDIGSGAGFPGLVLAELLRERAIRIVLIEATGKKCSFLEAVAARLDLAVDVRCARAEAMRPEPFDVITARACAPLSALLPYAEKFWHKDSIGLFLKGQSVAVELTDARKSWSMILEKHSSRSDPSGVVLDVRELRRVARL